MAANKFIIKIDPTELVPKSTARLYYYAAMFLTTVEAAAIGVMWKYIPVTVPLFFTEPWGEGRLAPKIYLFILPMLSLISIITNLVLGSKAKEESPLLSYSLAIASLLIVLMFAISLWGILQSLL